MSEPTPVVAADSSASKAKQYYSIIRSRMLSAPEKTSSPALADLVCEALGPIERSSALGMDRSAPRIRTLSSASGVSRLRQLFERQQQSSDDLATNGSIGDSHIQLSLESVMDQKSTEEPSATIAALVHSTYRELPATLDTTLSNSNVATGPTQLKKSRSLKYGELPPTLPECSFEYMELPPDKRLGPYLQVPEEGMTVDHSVVSMQTAMTLWYESTALSRNTSAVSLLQPLVRKCCHVFESERFTMQQIAGVFELVARPEK